jgi:hypothetical protein
MEAGVMTCEKAVDPSRQKRIDHSGLVSTTSAAGMCATMNFLDKKFHLIGTPVAAAMWTCTGQLQRTSGAKRIWEWAHMDRPAGTNAVAFWNSTGKIV